MMISSGGATVLALSPAAAASVCISLSFANVDSVDILSFFFFDFFSPDYNS